MGITNVGYSPPLSTTQSVYQNQKVAEKPAKDDKSTGVKSPADAGVVYEKSAGNTEKATYSVNKMSKADREALVSQLKADQEQRQSQLTSLVSQMMGKQATTYGNANMWKFLASGDYKVDAANKLFDDYYASKEKDKTIVTEE